MRKVIVIGKALRANNDLMSDKYFKINTKKLKAEIDDEGIPNSSDEKMIYMALAWFIEKHHDAFPKDYDPPFEDSYCEMTNLLHCLFMSMTETDSMEEYIEDVRKFLGLKSLKVKIIRS